MNYKDIFEILSQCGLGALLLSGDGKILDINAIGDQLLLGNGEMIGKHLSSIAPALCEPVEKKKYENIAFGKYVMRCPAPQADDLPPRAQLVTFQDASDSVQRDMLLSIVNQSTEGVILCDEKSRICLLNDAAVKMDSIVASEVIGDNIRNVYFTHDHSDLLVPTVIRDKTPMRNVRQYYTTRYGHDVDIVSNSFPVLRGEQTIGGFSLMEDWAMVDQLHKQIIDLQEKLTELTSPGNKRSTKSTLTAKYHFQDITHVSTAMHDIITHCKQAAKSDSSVMIYGETGTGKELIAQSLHNASKRANGPFLAINYAALPEPLLESLLFGTERGSYTGAESRAGLFEQANHGTLLLDELNSMNISVQSKLLRVLQDGMVRRVGSVSETHVDVRVLSSINVPPYQAIAEGNLRQDLFYRLGVVNITVPPLRERREDIPLLAKQFIMEFNKKLGKNVSNLHLDTLNLFQEYQWPGNVREFQHVIEHAMNIIPADCSVLTPEYIFMPAVQHPPAASGTPLPGTSQMPKKRAPAEEVSLNGHMQNVEREAICKVLRACGGNVTKAAKLLKMSRQSLQYRIKRYQIDLQELMQEAFQDLDF